MHPCIKTKGRRCNDSRTKIKGQEAENLESRLRPGCVSWILEAAQGERSWLNPNVAGKIGVGILLSHKYARLMTEHRA